MGKPNVAQSLRLETRVMKKQAQMMSTAHHAGCRTEMIVGVVMTLVLGGGGACIPPTSTLENAAS